MRKIIALFLAVTLCLCGCGMKDTLLPKNPYEDEIVFPSVPTPAQDLPAAPQSSEQADIPAEAVHPWDREFDETGYTIWKEEFDGGTAYTWLKGNEKGRQATYYNDGTIEDTYCYPNGFISHSCRWSADGSYSESHWLDNGYIEELDDGTKIPHFGTLFYSKTIHPDGSQEETQYNSQGIAEYTIHQFADGCYQELRYNDAGISILEITQKPDGYYEEIRYHENGSIKYRKSQSSECDEEVRYDEEGFVTFYHAKSADYEIEMRTDESGKLVQVIENGQTIEDPAILTQYVTSYNFRS